MSRVLDLTKVFDRDVVKMRDGTDYELRNPQEFSVVEEHQLQALLRKANEFDAIKAPTDEQVADASKMLQDLATMLVVDLETEIPDWACVAIFRFWMERATADNPPPKPAPRRRSRSTTASSSRASKRSTAATRNGGSSKSRAGR